MDRALAGERDHTARVGGAAERRHAARRAAIAAAVQFRGWASYFSVAETRNVFEDLDQWPWRKLLALGLDRGRARDSAFNGRGPWWSAGASHMNAALPTAYFRKNGNHLVTGRGALVDDAARAAVFMNRRDTEPYVRWCGRTVRF